jgi:methylmalonyl-CoA mutase
MVDSAFANPFPPADEALWRAAVDKVLKGADFDRKLVSRTLDGVTIQPLEPRRPDAALVARTAPDQPWRITARIDHPEPETASALALADLAGGADALTLVFEGAASARGFGLPTTDAATLNAALAGVELDLVAIRLDPAPQTRITARLFAEVVKARRLQPGDLDVDFGFDPVGLLARSGGLMVAWADAEKRLAEMLAEFGQDSAGQGHGFAGPFVRADARVVHEAGGSEAQELAYALASAVTYLRALERGGWAIDAADRALSFTLAVDADQFASIAKLRALRRLMTRVQQACGLDPRPIRLHAETAWRMLTRLDAPVNMLRNAIAGFSAGVGGADSVAVLPHTSALGLADGFARRVARNTQTVLGAESHLWRVADPSAGAGSIEALTDGLCAAAWDAFQQIEREGGLIASLQAGALQARTAATAAARAREIATGKALLTGTSAFPNLTETPDSVFDVAPKPARPGPTPVLTAAALPSSRLSEPFERLRGRASALAQSGVAAKVFLANLGAPAAFAARSGFAKSLFAVGGLEAVSFAGAPEPDGGTDLIALTDAFKVSGATLACLCGADEAYATEAADAAIALKASGAASVWLAGRPGENEASLRSAGVEHFIFTGADMVTALDAALTRLEAT